MRGALLAALSAELIAFSGTLLSESLFTVLAAGSLIAIKKSSEGRLSAISAGGLAACTTLVRAVSLPVFPILLVLGTRQIRLASFALLALAAPLITWSVAASQAHERVVLVANSGGLNLWIGHGPGSTGDWRKPGPEPVEGYGAAAKREILADPAAALHRFQRNLFRLFSFGTSSRTMATRPIPLPLVPFGIVVILGTVGAIRCRDPVLIGWVVLSSLSTAVFFAPTRYKLVLYPALIPLAALALAPRAKSSTPAPHGESSQSGIPSP